MVGKYKVITLCGSTRFKDAFLEAQKRLTLEGNIVISVGLFGHSGDGEVWTPGTKVMLDDMHKRKIDMADEIFVINVGGYIGESTRSEIEYAMAAGKKVRYLEEPESVTWKQQTLQYYSQDPDRFIIGTLTADMSDTRERFCKHLPSKALILDFGCGSGRDAKAFLDSGFCVEATDGSRELCDKASEYIGIPVKQMLFNELNAENKYDGIWACASILHLPKTELAEVLKKIETALKQGGILYTSFKYGTFEGIRADRYFSDFTEETLREFWQEATSLQIFDLWITHDVRPGREEEQWINLLARKT